MASDKIFVEKTIEIHLPGSVMHNEEFKIQFNNNSINANQKPAEYDDKIKEGLEIIDSNIDIKVSDLPTTLTIGRKVTITDTIFTNKNTDTNSLYSKVMIDNDVFIKKSKIGGHVYSESNVTISECEIGDDIAIRIKARVINSKINNGTSIGTSNIVKNSEVKRNTMTFQKVVIDHVTIPAFTKIHANISIFLTGFYTDESNQNANFTVDYFLDQYSPKTLKIKSGKVKTLA